MNTINNKMNREFEQAEPIAVHEADLLEISGGISGTSLTERPTSALTCK